MKVTIEEFNRAVVAALRRLKRRIEDLEARVAELEARPTPRTNEQAGSDDTFGPQVKRCGKLGRAHERAVHRIRALSGDADEPGRDIPLPEPLEPRTRRGPPPVASQPIDLANAIDIDID